jgi:hypothetical protein
MSRLSGPPRRRLFTPPLTRVEATITAVFYVGVALGAVQLLLMTIEDIGVVRVLTGAGALMACGAGFLVFFFGGLWCTDASGQYERTRRELRTWHALLVVIGYATLSLLGFAAMMFFAGVLGSI